MAIDLIPLSAVRDLAPLTRLMGAAWPAYYGETGPGDASNDLRARCGAAGFPFGIAAFQGDIALGTGAVTNGESFGATPGEGPWLIGLVVAPNARRQGIGAALITALEAEAKARGATGVFCTTRTAAGIVTRAGWHKLRQVQDEKGAEWQVFHKRF